LQRHHWTGHRASARSEFVGHCPLHEEESLLLPRLRPRR
jgi:hypothetical protein